jgi:hypothetical protein
MTGKNCDLFTHKSSGSYLNHLVEIRTELQIFACSIPDVLEAKLKKEQILILYTEWLHIALLTQVACLYDTIICFAFFIVPGTTFLSI